MKALPLGLLYGAKASLAYIIIMERRMKCICKLAKEVNGKTVGDDLTLLR